MNGLEKIKLIIFDVDGTLAETDDYFVEKATVMTGKVLPFVKRSTIEKPVRAVVMAGETGIHLCYRLLDMIGLDSVLHRFHNRMSVGNAYKYREVEGMSGMLDKLSRDYQIGIITSGGRKSTDAFIEKFGIADRISYVISAEDCRFIKPHPMPILTMAARAGIPAANCLMVGDTVFDILCAKRAGALSAAVKTGFDSLRFLRLFHADIELDSVSDLPEVLSRSRGEMGDSMDKPKDLV